MKINLHSGSNKVAAVLFSLLATTGFAVLGSFFTAWLWNQLMPELFGLKTITWSQGLGLGLLARCIWGTGGLSSSKD